MWIYGTSLRVDRQLRPELDLHGVHGGREFSPDQIDRARVNLERAADEDRVRVFFNQHLLEEVSGCWHNPTIRWKVPVLLAALSRLAKNRWLRLPVRIKEHPAEAGRHEREARVQGPVPEAERFIEPHRVAPALAAIAANEQNVIIESGDKAYQAKRDYPDSERGRRADALQLAPAEVLAEFVGQWNQGSVAARHALIDDWTMTKVEAHAQEWGLPDDKSQWPPMSAFRSIWFERAYCVARLMEFLPTGKTDGGDLYDAGYFWDAAYADVLVTTDEGLLRRAHTIQAPGLRAVHLRDWLPEWLDG